MGAPDLADYSKIRHNKMGEGVVRKPALPSLIVKITFLTVAGGNNG